MVLFLVGLGLGNEKDITLRGLEAVKSCDKVFLESYTSLLGVDKDRLEALYGHQIIVAERELVEEKADEITSGAINGNVAFLVVGDPFGATTHTDLFLRAKQAGVQVEVIHNASIMNAVGACGLQLYSFGETVSLVFFTDSWRPDSFYPKVLANKQRGLHTLCLLDIKVREPTLESLARGGRKEYEPPRFMSVAQAVAQLLEVEDNVKGKAYGPDTLCVGLARIGQEDQRIAYGTMAQMLSFDMGPPLHSLIIPGDKHDIDEEILGLYRLEG